MKTIIALTLALLNFAAIVTAQDGQKAAVVPTDAKGVKPLAAEATVPTLTLLSMEGKEFDLNAAIAKKPTVLIFYRGGWCPFCTKHLTQIQQIEGDLLKLGYQILAVSPDRPEKLTLAAEKHSLKYTLLSDSKMVAAKAFGLAFTVDDATVTKYKGYGIDLEGDSGETHHMLPVPAAYLVDTKGVIRFAYTNSDYKVRLTADELLKQAQDVVKERGN